MSERRLDEELLIFASVGRVACAVAGGFLEYWEERLQIPLNLLTKEHFDKGVVYVRADLDVPTFSDKIAKGRMEGATGGSGGRYNVGWEAISVTLNILASATRLLTELGVLVKVLSSQRDGISFAIVHLGQEISKIFLAPDWDFSYAHGQPRAPRLLLFVHFLIIFSAWGAITDNEHYIRLAGLSQLVQDPDHKQEIVAGNLAEFIKAGKLMSFVLTRAQFHLFHSIHSGLRTSDRQVCSMVGDFALRADDRSPIRCVHAFSNVSRTIC